MYRDLVPGALFRSHGADGRGHGLGAAADFQVRRPASTCAQAGLRSGTPFASFGVVFRISHVSDLHVLSPFGFEWRRALFNKRLTGYANLIRQRGRVHRREYLLAVLSEAAEHSDHVVVTGDIVNLSLESEYEEAAKLLSDVSRKVDVTVVPGNHDVYLPSIHKHRRFPHHFRQFLRSDLPELSRDLPMGPFPCVKLRGPVALIALSSAVPRPPFVASGFIGHVQLEAFEAALAHPEVARRTPVILVHHPPVDRRMTLERLRDGLVDAVRLRHSLSRVTRALVLYGHVHYRSRQRLPTAAGAAEIVSASGAGLDHPKPAVRAGFNMYSFTGDGGIASADARVIAPDGRSLERVPIPGWEELA